MSRSSSSLRSSQEYDDALSPASHHGSGDYKGGVDIRVVSSDDEVSEDWSTSTTRERSRANDPSIVSAVKPKDCLGFLGPGFLITIAYVDPGTFSQSLSLSLNSIYLSLELIFASAFEVIFPLTVCPSHFVSESTVACAVGFLLFSFLFLLLSLQVTLRWICKPERSLVRAYSGCC